MAHGLIKVAIIASISFFSISSSLLGVYSEFFGIANDGQENIFFEQDGIDLAARLQEDNFQVYQDGEWESITIKGVNMGLAKPGYFPGEAAITYDEYVRWIDQIGEMNANVIRTFAVHPPQFYKALNEYNSDSESPIFLMQGVWVNEEIMSRSEDAFNEEFTEDFQASIKKTIDVLCGSGITGGQNNIPPGVYDDDVSAYVLGIIIGIEWAPSFVIDTDVNNNGMEDLSGSYLITENGSPFEIWLAGVMNEAIRYGTDVHSYQVPMSFINYQSLDKIDHPSEPVRYEDKAVIDPDHIQSTDEYLPGMFATFHVYPYYPDFMNYDEEYKGYIDANGECNNFAGYLNDLQNVHETPIFIGEFGVPSSDGISHNNVHGMNQGHLTEQEQGEINSKLFLSIIDEGLTGGAVFTWQDEWYKTSWNTVSNINTDLNQNWFNALNSEESYELMSFDPGMTDRIVLDGQDDDWLNIDGYSVRKEVDGKGLSKVSITNDEGYLYFNIQDRSGKDTNTMILIDTIDNQGMNDLPEGISSELGIDFIVDIDNNGDSKVLVDSDYDIFEHRYGNPSVSEGFSPIRMIVSSELWIPGTEDIIEKQDFEIGALEWGTTDPDDASFNSNADIYGSSKGDNVEVRIPWNLLNFRSPGNKEIIGNINVNGIGSSLVIEDIKVYVITYSIDKDSEDGVKVIKDTMSFEDDLTIESNDFISYNWPTWDIPESHERLKSSYYVMKEAFSNV